MLVDDSVDIQMLVGLFFEKTSVQLDVEGNGADAVESFKGGRYDLLLMDLEMPLMNGITACEKIRMWEKAKKKKAVPIIALTGKRYDGGGAELKKAGFDDYLLKPMKRGELFYKIGKHVN